MSASPVRRAWMSFREHYPALAKELRNGGELLRYFWLRGRYGAAAQYGESFWDFHEVGDWAGFARVAHRYLGAESIVDVGCGDAKLLASLAELDPSLRLLGVEPSAAARTRAAARGIPVDQIDVTALSRHETEHLRRAVSQFSAAICLEVAEHLPPWHSRRLVRILTGAPVILFSAATPGQGGTGHVNEQPESYWNALFGEFGHRLSPQDAMFRREVADLELPSWYRTNVHLFVHG